MDLGDVVTEVAESLAWNGQTLDVGALPVVHTDAVAVRHVLQNLLVNALTHAGPDATVSITAARRQHGWRVTVADDGPGVPPEERESVFAPFVRGTASSGRPGTGLGLGLAIVRRLVDRLGGELRLDPTEHGASFSFTLAATTTPDEHPSPGPDLANRPMAAVGRAR